MTTFHDCYEQEIEHRTDYRLGEVAGQALKTKRGKWAMKVDDHAGGVYWLGLDDDGVVRTNGVRVGLVAQLVPADRHHRSTPSPTLREVIEHDAYWVAMSEQEGQPFMIDFSSKPRIFLANLIRHGFQLRVNDAGQLVVTPPADYEIPPVLSDEIYKRRLLLIDILTPAPPASLEKYFGRLIGQSELNASLVLAKEAGVTLRHTRDQAKYLLEIDTVPAPVDVVPMPAMKAAA